MTFSTLMTHVQPEAEARPRLDFAVGLAERFGARLIGLGAEMIPPLAFDNGFYPVDAEWVIAMRESIEDQLEVSRDLFHRQAARLPEGDALWVCGVESPTSALTVASRAADLIVLGGAGRRHPNAYRDASPAELAMRAGRPVLVAPPTAPALSAKTIVLAWKDTREARRALTDALPFFERAETVVVLEVYDRDGEEDAKVRTEDVVAALRRRGVPAEAKVTPHGHGPLSVCILDEARARGADLVVLGCYGHTRLGEWVFGGVTRDILAQDEVHLLLSH